MELMCATGIRRLEAVNLEVGDVDFTRETVFIKEGKGKKDRIIPISPRALKWVQRYLDDIRPHLAYKDTKNLFLTQYGNPLKASFVSDLVTSYIKKASVALMRYESRFQTTTYTASPKLKLKSNTSDTIPQFSCNTPFFTY